MKSRYLNCMMPGKPLFGNANKKTLTSKATKTAETLLYTLPLFTDVMNPHPSRLPPQSGVALSFPWHKIIYPWFLYCKFFSRDFGKIFKAGANSVFGVWGLKCGVAGHKLCLGDNHYEQALLIHNSAVVIQSAVTKINRAKFLNISAASPRVASSFGLNSSSAGSTPASASAFADVSAHAPIWP